MRLINTSSYNLVTCYESEIVDYAILSHTWTEHELSMQDWQLIHYQHLPPAATSNGTPCDHCRSLEDYKATLRNKPGFRKIVSFLAQAQRDGFEYAWADTICIDRASSAEISESVIAAWLYYERAGACYVYLEDVEAGGLLWKGTWTEKALTQFGSARWWTRGWTLIELLAPRRVRFFDVQWGFFGTKTAEKLPMGSDVAVSAGACRYAGWSLQNEITRRRGFEQEELRRFERRSASVAKKMSWMCERRTRMEEDRAYALMGLFGVCLPILYGEGEMAAFQRLQREIVGMSDDDTIFSWCSGGFVEGSRWTGLLAPSIDCFKGVGKVVSLSHGRYRRQVKSSGRGIQIEREVIKEVGSSLMLLNCCFEDDPAKRPLGIHIAKLLDCQTSDMLFGFPVDEAMAPEDVIAEVKAVRDLSVDCPVPVDLSLYPMLSRQKLYFSEDHASTTCLEDHGCRNKTRAAERHDEMEALFDDLLPRSMRSLQRARTDSRLHLQSQKSGNLGMIRRHSAVKYKPPLERKRAVTMRM